MLTSPQPTSVAQPERERRVGSLELMGHPSNASSQRRLLHRTARHIAGCSVNLAVINLTLVTFPNYCVEDTHTQRNTARPHSITHVQTPHRRAALAREETSALRPPRAIALVALLRTAAASPAPCLSSREQSWLPWLSAGPAFCFLVAN